MVFTFDSEEETIVVDDVRFHISCLQVLLQADPNKFYQFTKKEDVVWVKVVDAEVIRAQLLTGANPVN